MWPESALREDEGSPTFWENQIKKERQKESPDQNRIEEYRMKRTRASRLKRIDELEKALKDAKKAKDQTRVDSIQERIDNLKSQLEPQ